MQVLGVASTPMQITPSVTARAAVTAIRISAASATGLNGTAQTQQAKKEADTEKIQEQKNALTQLKTAPDDRRATAKAEAWKKVELLKQLLKQMKALAAGNPKYMAKALVQLAKDLAAAVKQYVQAGGTSDATGVQSNIASSTTGTESENAQADTYGATGSVGATNGHAGANGGTTPQNNAQSAETAAAIYQKIQDGLQGPPSSAAPQIGGNADQSFFDTVREFEGRLREVVSAVKQTIPSQSGGSDHDVEETEKNLAEMDRTMTAGSSGGVPLGSRINLNA